jgi:hypothetical protein
MFDWAWSWRIQEIQTRESGIVCTSEVYPRKQLLQTRIFDNVEYQNAI